MSSSGADIFNGNKSVESFYAGADIALAANTDTEIASLVVPVGKWKITGLVLPYTDGAVQVPMDVWIGPDSASHAASYAASSAAVGSLATGTGVDFTLMTFEAIVTLAAQTTVYLNAAASATGIHITATTYVHSIGHVTGIVAIPVT